MLLENTCFCYNRFWSQMCIWQTTIDQRCRLNLRLTACLVDSSTAESPLWKFVVWPTSSHRASFNTYSTYRSRALTLTPEPWSTNPNPNPIIPSDDSCFLWLRKWFFKSSVSFLSCILRHPTVSDTIFCIGCVIVCSKKNFWPWNCF